MDNKELGTQIIRDLGMGCYIMWVYLGERGFVRPYMEEMVEHFGRHPRTLRTWLKKLESNGYIQKKSA